MRAALLHVDPSGNIQNPTATAANRGSCSTRLKYCPSTAVRPIQPREPKYFSSPAASLSPVSLVLVRGPTVCISLYYTTGGQSSHVCLVYNLSISCLWSIFQPIFTIRPAQAFTSRHAPQRLNAVPSCPTGFLLCIFHQQSSVLSVPLIWNFLSQLSLHNKSSIYLQIVLCEWPGGNNGNVEASTTLKPLTPITRALESVTATVSFTLPI